MGSPARLSSFDALVLRHKNFRQLFHHLDGRTLCVEHLTKDNRVLWRSNDIFISIVAYSLVNRLLAGPRSFTRNYPEYICLANSSSFQAVLTVRTECCFENIWPLLSVGTTACM